MLVVMIFFVNCHCHLMVICFRLYVIVGGKWQVASVIYINFNVNKLVATMLQGYKLVVTRWILFHKACCNAFVIKNLDNGQWTL